MRAMIGLVIFMGVLIVAGVGTIVATVLHRIGAALPGAATAPPETVTTLPLKEPPGTHILQASESAGHLTAVLQGGGPDRIVIIDLATGRTLARVTLAP
jgi:hypothetical protein